MAVYGGFEEIVLPSIEPVEVYKDKAGPEIMNQMYVFPDKKDRQLCLRPEGTATCQLLADSVLKNERDIKLCYLTTCWRYERPQAGRYREFLQFGVEWLNPRYPEIIRADLLDFAKYLIGSFTMEYVVAESVKRGLAYYVEDGFEISISSLGAQKQVCGGGSYKQGCGFAIGVDRLALVFEKEGKNGT